MAHRTCDRSYPAALARFPGRTRTTSAATRQKQAQLRWTPSGKRDWMRNTSCRAPKRNHEHLAESYREREEAALEHRVVEAEALEERLAQREATLEQRATNLAHREETAD